MASSEFPKGKYTMPGMDEAQKKADSRTFATTVEMITRGVFEDPDYCSGPVVGNPYDEDMFGEDRDMITWKGGKK